MASLFPVLDSRSYVTVLLVVVVWLVCLRYHRNARRRSLAGLTVLITGCDTGLGQHIALHLQSIGMVVYAACLTRDAVIELNDRALPRLHSLQLDVTSDSSAAAALSFVAGRSASLDCLINNAGVFDTFLCELTPISSYQQCLSVNFLGTVRMLHHFGPLLRSSVSGGRMLTIGSFLGTISSWSLSGYSASKWALEAWHDSVRGELGMFGVQCSLIQPGTMRTQLVSQVGATYRRRWECGSESVKADYGADMLRVIPAVQRIMEVLSSDTVHVVRAVEYQMRRHVMDSRVRVGWDSWVCGLARYIPISDHMMDWTLAALVSIPQPAAVTHKVVGPQLQRAAETACDR